MYLSEFQQGSWVPELQVVVVQGAGAPAAAAPVVVVAGKGKGKGKGKGRLSPTSEVCLCRLWEHLLGGSRVGISRVTCTRK